MYATPEYVALIQREREEHVEMSRLARIASCVRAACHPSLLDRVARILRTTPASC